MSTVWLLRNDKLDDDLERLGIVSIGWDGTPDLSSVNKDELKSILRKTEPGKTPNSYASDAGVLLRFYGELAVGDIVVAPRQDGKHLRIGTVTGQYRFDENAATHRHRRAVTWNRQGVARHDLPEEVRRGLKNIRTLSLVNHGVDEFRKMAADPGYTPPLDDVAAEDSDTPAVDTGIHSDRQRGWVAGLLHRREEPTTFRNPLPSVQPVYAAAEAWRQALVEGVSLFSGQPMNYADAAATLTHDFIDSPDTGTDDFLTKWQRQLENSSDDAVQLAAELFFIYYLPMSTSSSSGKLKASSIATVVNWREAVRPVPEEYSEALRAGIARTGTAYMTLRYKVIAYLVRIIAKFFTLEGGERRTALTDWDSFQKALEDVDDQGVWSMRMLLEHLLFPAVAVDTSSRGDKPEMAVRLGAGEQDAAEANDLRFCLEPNLKYGDQESLALYRPPYRNAWKEPTEQAQRWAKWAVLAFGDLASDGSEDGIEQASGAFSTTTEKLPRLLADLLGEDALLTRRAGDDAAGLNRLLQDIDDLGVALFIDKVAEWSGVSDLSRMSDADRDALLEDLSTLLLGRLQDLPIRVAGTVSRLERLTSRDSPSESATPGEYYLAYLDRIDILRAALELVSGVTPSRVEVAQAADQLLDMDDAAMVALGWSDETRKSFVAWRSNKKVDPPSETDALEGSVDESDVDADDSSVMMKEGPSTLDFEELAERLSIDSDRGKEWLDDLVAMLDEKKQVILQGPPGTGKTFIARALAEHFATPDRVDVVQFHPGTAYEDFVQGLRPDPGKPGAFHLSDGPLVRLANRAREDRENVYILIIDEINRANLPVVFGELYFLLEYRGDEVTMTYGDRFGLPENVLIVGTMNTADRSITAVDAALRRRFYVIDVRPDDTPLDEILPAWLEVNAPNLTWLTDLLIRANEKIGDPDRAIGPSHFMQHPLTEEKAKRAWAFSVVPTLRELFYGQPERVDDLRFDQLKAVVTKVTVDADAE
ncbi:hypothetical protein BJF89_06180 [Corynebacterium sp. CNJ-954]|uniref:AAA family ATPase n=1 Tax=Corynebacterium sp. CNJ-954 TaxID=1904962 RepID=UPI000961E973|nr:AAA family ATPase [Corynebacterium sp. CNJ-954]OLT52002.1 hypothetical protein BJF89_06180 [Corynebacterium sp. CNJ-954]